MKTDRPGKALKRTISKKSLLTVTTNQLCHPIKPATTLQHKSFIVSTSVKPQKPELRKMQSPFEEMTEAGCKCLQQYSVFCQPSPQLTTGNMT